MSSKRLITYAMLHIELTGSFAFLSHQNCSSHLIEYDVLHFVISYTLTITILSKEKKY